MWFDSWADLGRVVAVGSVAYLALVVVLRAAGKRTLSKLNAFDFVVTVAFGSTLATILLSKDVSWAEGAAALALLAFLQLMLSWIVSRLPASRGLVNATGSLVLVDGHFIEDAMRRERLTADQVSQAVRAAGLGSHADAGAVVLETDGSLSVVPKRNLSDRTALAGLRTEDERETAGRGTRQVVESHLGRRAAGDLAGDLVTNYASDVVLLSAEGVHRGHDGVRRLAGILHRYLDGGTWTVSRLEVEGAFALIEWRGTGAEPAIHDGADSFVVVGGKIVAQTIHYSAGDTEDGSG